MSAGCAKLANPIERNCAMTFPLRDAVAVVTGAASGIGAALALELASRGCHLALVDRDRDPLAPLVIGAKRSVAVSAHVADVADPVAAVSLRDAVLAEHGRVSVLVNNAGVALFGRFEELEIAEMEWLFAVNFWGTVRMCKAFVPALRREAAARVVCPSRIFCVVRPRAPAAPAGA